jgi:hypothetical protein
LVLKKEVKNKFLHLFSSWTPAAFSAGSPPAKRIKLENGETFLKTEGEEDNKVGTDKNRFLSFDLDPFHSFSPQEKFLRGYCTVSDDLFYHSLRYLFF